MRPTELPLERWVVPGGEPRTLVVLTGAALRHDRFALRVIETFGPQVIAWYRYKPGGGGAGGESPGGGSTAGPGGFAGAASDSVGVRGLRFLRAHIRDRGLRATAERMPAMLRHKLATRRILRERARRQVDVEKQMFGDEVIRLSAATHLRPVDVADPNDPTFVETVGELSPWLLLTFGGPLYRKPLLGTARGAVINQHAGWSPEYRGTNTIDQALHHRQLEYVGNTVHLSATGADSGKILRRAHPSLTPDDTPESIFARVTAVGNELMLEVVQELIDRGETLVAEQPTDRGRTYLSRDLDPRALVRTARDFENGWLEDELRRLAQF